MLILYDVIVWYNATYKERVVMNKYIRWFFISNSVTTALRVLLDAIITFYLLSKGFTLTAISLCFATSLIFTTLLEFPSGVLADRFGRKAIYALAMFCRFLQCLILLISHHLLLLVVCGMLEGIYNAFRSGSLDAWLLKSTKIIDFNKLLGLNKTIVSMSAFIFMFISAFIIHDITLIIKICCFMYFILSVLHLVYLKDNRDENTTVKQIMITSLSFLKHQKAQFLMIILVMFYALISVYMLLYQAQVKQVGYGDAFILQSSLLALVSAMLAGVLFAKYATNQKDVFVVVCLIGVAISFYFIQIADNAYVLLVANTLYGFSQAIMFPYFYSELFQILPEHSLAATISAVSAIASLFAAVITILLGMMSDMISLTSIAYIGIIFAVSSIFILYKLLLNRE